MNEEDRGAPMAERGMPFPSSLCHQCAAPPRYVATDRGSVFLHCPVLKRYPPQPVLACDAFAPRSPSE